MTKPARSCGRPDAAAAPGGPRAASFLGTATTGTQPATISFDSERGRTGLGGTSSGEYRRFRIATRFTPEIVPLPTLAGQSAEPPPDRAGAEGTRPTARQPPRRARPAMRPRVFSGPLAQHPNRRSLRRRIVDSIPAPLPLPPCPAALRAGSGGPPTASAERPASRPARPARRSAAAPDDRPARCWGLVVGLHVQRPPALASNRDASIPLRTPKVPLVPSLGGEGCE
jgi:hypothetical protein